MITPKDIKLIRQKLGITQNQFAKMAGLSQSMIAKVEAGKLDPTYSNFMKLSNTIEKLSSRNERTAADIMNKKILFVEPKTKILSVNKIMKTHGISQIPVMDGNLIIGLITESSILDSDLSVIDSLTAENVMVDSPPTIAEDTPLTVVSTILRHFPLVFVISRGELVGIITKADILKNLL